MKGGDGLHVRRFDWLASFVWISSRHACHTIHVHRSDRSMSFLARYLDLLLFGIRDLLVHGLGGTVLGGSPLELQGLPAGHDDRRDSDQA